MAQQLSESERLAVAKDAYVAIQAANSKGDVVEVFKRYYGTIGHKAIGRMILGQSPEKALRLA